MDSLLAFLLFIAAATAIGWQAGDHQDQKIMVFIGSAAISSAIADALFDGSLKYLTVAVIDIILLGVMLRYALYSKRHWPIWFGAVHLVGLICQAAALFFSQNSRIILEYLSGACSVAAICAMVVGLVMDRRANVVQSA